MSGYDLVNGAIRGYQLVDNTYRQNERDAERKEYRKEAIATDNYRYENAQDSKEKQFQETQKHRAAIQGNSERAAIAQEKRTANTAAQNKWTQEQAEAKTGRGVAKTKRQQLVEKALILGGRAEKGVEDFPKDFQDELNAEGLGYYGYYNGITNPKQHNATLALAPILEQVGRGDISAINSPESLKLLNQVLMEQINTGLGEFNQQHGSKIVKKEISSLEAAPGGKGFVAELLVTLENGVQYIAPRTLNGTTLDMDTVKMIDMGQAMDDLQGRILMAQHFEQRKDAINLMYRSQNPALKDPNAGGAEWDRRQGVMQGDRVDLENIKQEGRMEKSGKKVASQADNERMYALDYAESRIEEMKTLRPFDDEFKEFGGEEKAKQYFIQEYYNKYAPSRLQGEEVVREPTKNEVNLAIEANPGWDEVKAIKYVKHLLKSNQL